MGFAIEQDSFSEEDFARLAEKLSADLVAARWLG
jgi:hypothetical protein